MMEINKYPRNNLATDDILDVTSYALTDDEINLTAHVVKSMAHPLRLKLLCLIGEEEKPVQKLTEDISNTSQSNISQHLSHLLERKVLTNRKVGNQVLYRIRDKRLIQLIYTMQAIYCGSYGRS